MHKRPWHRIVMIRYNDYYRIQQNRCIGSCLLSHTIHPFILTSFHTFSHHLICITLITSHIHLLFVPHHPHSILLPFHHSRISSLFHSSISPWCSSRIPQNSFSLISFIVPSYSIFHSSFHPISPPSPSSPLIPGFHSLSHLCSLYIHFHPFPSHSSSQPLPSHSLLSISIPILSFHSISSFPFISYFSIFLLCIPLLSFLRFSSTCLNYEINTMFVRIVVIACSFVLLIGNTLSQLDVIAFTSDG